MTVIDGEIVFETRFADRRANNSVLEKVNLIYSVEATKIGQN